jgi:endonuclease/exonuclease/phosphatase family metal-dependent hydrolase
MFATVAALLVLPFVDEDPQPPAAVSQVAAATPSSRPIEPRTVQPQRIAGSQGGRVSRGIAPVRLKPVRVGVASFNMFRKLSAAQAHQDAMRLTRRRGVDVVGWQEADRFAGPLHHLPGWQTRTFPFGRRHSELAVSWRASEFRLVSAHQRQVALGVSWREGRYPFGNRMVVTATLEHRATGRLLTIVNAHLPQAIEDLDRPGRWTPTINAFRARNQLHRIRSLWRQAPGRWVVGTGDFNFDARADAVHRPVGGPRRVLGSTAVSSYMRLGTGLPPTYPGNGRHIDYVWADRRGYADGRVRFAGQWVVGGLNSDHNALLARLVLS